MTAIKKPRRERKREGERDAKESARTDRPTGGGSERIAFYPRRATGPAQSERRPAGETSEKKTGPHRTSHTAKSPPALAASAAPDVAPREKVSTAQAKGEQPAKNPLRAAGLAPFSVARRRGPSTERSFSSRCFSTSPPAPIFAALILFSPGLRPLPPPSPQSATARAPTVADVPCPRHYRASSTNAPASSSSERPRCHEKVRRAGTPGARESGENERGAA